ncbi:polynucleotide adenylyltransferase PcnB [Shewanella baltica]|uniref:polynucleotide adenylyltransferase PcnB n=1 Tax=Shewanella baltica TaxID=62322 RepID=UPI00217CEADF|nr:polynucleotide adenylyltransferase PcnB [Shewanella baltica]MCS6135043.1 polynucleotide adenylyltransferase PcnB [Shewanella baltica]
MVYDSRQIFNQITDHISRCPIFRRISQFCKQLFEDAPKTTAPTPAQIEPTTPEQSSGALSLELVPRDAHTISRKQISENALKVLYRLNKSGFKAYLVGGGVRDLLLGIEPKDFDVVTNATPEEIKKLFRNCRVVGRRFRLAHIVFGRDVIEVATFRGHHGESNEKVSKANAEGRLLRDNVYGEIDEDAERRDFTVNALYYDISDYSIRSYGGGMADLKAGTLRLIGDPETRYREDPVRMLRAVRFATKLNMGIETVTAAPIKQLAPLLKDIPAARMYEEVLKLFFAGKALANFELMQEYKLFVPLFPQVAALLKDDPKGTTMKMVQAIMKSTDQRVNEDKPVTPSFFYAALLWYPLRQRAEDIAVESGLTLYDAFFAAMGDVMEQQCQTISIPRRFSTPAKDIWQLQLRFDRSQGTRAFKLMEHPKFRAAYDLLLLRGEVEAGNVAKSAAWWQQFVEADETERLAIARSGSKSPNRNRNATQRRRRPRAPNADGSAATSAPKTSGTPKAKAAE